MAGTGPASSDPHVPSIQALIRFVETAPLTDDDVEIALRLRLQAAVVTSNA